MKTILVYKVLLVKFRLNSVNSRKIPVNGEGKRGRKGDWEKG
jgi:hypothetical protein